MRIILNYLLNPEILPENIWNIVKIIRVLFFLFSGFLIFIILLSWKKSNWLKVRYLERMNEFLKVKTYDVNKFSKNWQKIKKRTELELEAEYRLAIIEADAMLEEVLTRIGYTQKTLDEKIDSMTIVELKNIEDLKIIRKIRNSIVHDPSYRLTLDKTKEALLIYENSLKELGVI